MENKKGSGDLGNELRIAMMFIKAKKEVEQNRIEREEKMKRKAKESAEERRRIIAEREAYAEWCRNHRSTEEQKEQARRNLIECLKENCGLDLDKYKEKKRKENSPMGNCEDDNK